jgi:hypothetical protein
MPVNVLDLLGQLIIVLAVMLYAFLIGAAISAGAWVAWWLLEERRRGGQPGALNVIQIRWIILAALVFAAASFAFLAPTAIPAGLPRQERLWLVVIQFIPFVTSGGLS